MAIPARRPGTRSRSSRFVAAALSACLGIASTAIVDVGPAAAVAGAPQLAYVAYGNLNVIDVPTNTVVASIAVGSGPYSVAVSPDSAFVYVASGNGVVSVVNAATRKVVKTIPVGSNPVGVAVSPDGTLAYVANFNSATLSVIQTATNTVSATVPMPSSPKDIAFTPNGAFAYVTNYNGIVSVINTATSAIVTNVTAGDTPDGVAVTADGAFVYVANRGDNNVSVIATASNTVVGTVPVGQGPIGVTVSPNGAVAYVANEVSNTVSIVSTSTNTVIATVATGVNPLSVAFTSDGAFAYVSSTAGGKVTVVNTATRKAVKTITNAGGLDIAIGDNIFNTVTVVAQPGATVASSASAPTDARPTKQVLTLPNIPSARPITITLQSITPGRKQLPPDKLLCPTSGNKCSGQISVFAGNFKQYVSRARPIEVQIIAKWKTKVGLGKLLMAQDSGGPPIQLALCIVKGGLYNTPCLKSEVVSGTAARHNLVTTSTILFTGVDPRFARHVANGPDAPIAVKATAGKGKATLQWKRPVVTNGTITGYTITPRLGSAAQKSVSVAGSALKATVSGLKKGKSYTFTIIAKNARGVSLASKPSNAVKPT